MLRVIVLGAAAGGGVPQWNCGCHICAGARTNPALRATQASIAVSVDPSLLGGMIVKIGSRQIDTSLKTKLNSLKLALKEVG